MVSALPMHPGLKLPPGRHGHDKASPADRGREAAQRCGKRRRPPHGPICLPKENGPRALAKHAARYDRFSTAAETNIDSCRCYFADATLPSAPFTLIFSVVPSALATFTVY